MNSRFMEDWKKEVGDREPGRFAHYCYDWDGLLIDEHCVEASSCHDMEYDEEAKACIKAAEEEFDRQCAESYCGARSMVWSPEDALPATLPTTASSVCMHDPPEEE